ncbi:MAG: IS110 family transposase, partial [Opitutae bacterium]|nr:IS110 family transposase [Opitutae bacterium]
DAEDARMLARLGRADPALLSPIKHRSEQGQRALLRLKVREALVRSRVAPTSASTGAPRISRRLTNERATTRHSLARY